MIRDKIRTATYSEVVCCDVGLKGARGNVFFKSVRVYFGRVRVGRSVCFWENVWVTALRELEFRQFC